jgi:hypothetical membrane protein
MSTAARSRIDEECTPEARVTKSLLGYGPLAGIVYVLGSVIDGLTRPGFDFTRDSWSVLSLGPRGWVHVVVFVLTGLMVLAAAVGMRRHIGRARGRTGAVLLGVWGVLLVLAGLFPPDPTGSRTFSTHGMVHLAAGGLGFVCLALACFSMARRFRAEGRPGAGFSIAAGVLVLLGFGAIASGSTAPAVVLGFTATVLLGWVWLAWVSIRFYREADADGRAEARRRAAAVD